MGNCFACVQTGSVGIVAKFGKFQRFVPPGLAFLCCGDALAGVLSLKVQQLNVSLETVTHDSVSVTLVVSVLYQVSQEGAMEQSALPRRNQTQGGASTSETAALLLNSGDCGGDAPSTSAARQDVARERTAFMTPPEVNETWYKAFYMLTDVKAQMQAHVAAAVRAIVPTLTLDALFAEKLHVATHVKQDIADFMALYGFSIIDALITDIVPAAKVKVAMNEINASARLREAALHKAEAAKVAVVKQAEAHAEAKFLAGQGISRERAAIMHGMQESVADFSKSADISASEVMDMMLITTYFDTMHEIGARGKAATVFVPHQPGALAETAAQLRQGLARARRTHDAAAPPTDIGSLV